MRHLPPSGRLRSFGLRLTAFHAALYVAVMGLVSATGNAQHHVEPATTATRLIAVQYEDRLATETEALQLPLPLPAVEVDQVDYRSDHCLKEAGSVAIAARQTTLNLELGLAPQPNSGREATSCSTAVDLLFWEKQRSWAATVNVAITRLPHVPELSHDEVSTTFNTDLISISQHLRPSYLTTVVLLSLTNHTTTPLAFHGFGDTAEFVAAVGPVYRYDPTSFSGSYDSLLNTAQPLEAFSLAPGEAAHLAIVYDPDRRLPDAAGAVTIRPVAVVESAGRPFVVPFPRINTVWGQELR